MWAEQPQVICEGEQVGDCSKLDLAGLFAGGPGRALRARCEVQGARSKMQVPGYGFFEMRRVSCTLCTPPFAHRLPFQEQEAAKHGGILGIPGLRHIVTLLCIDPPIITMEYGRVNGVSDVPELYGVMELWSAEYAQTHFTPTPALRDSCLTLFPLSCSHALMLPWPYRLLSVPLSLCLSVFASVSVLCVLCLYSLHSVLSVRLCVSVGLCRSLCTKYVLLCLCAFASVSASASASASAYASAS